jgi:uncharacterized membrane protein YdbT with pleckstrin-like domain
MTDDEHVVLHLHPHWIVMIIPTFWFVLLVAAVGAAGVFWNNVATLVVGAFALAFFLWLVFWPFLEWRSTHYVFTNERVMLREGVFNRIQRDIPLTRVNDVSSGQNLMDRVLGCGKLTVESAGERGQSILVNIPKVVRVQKVVYELVEADHERRTLDDDDLRQALREARGEAPETK